MGEAWAVEGARAAIEVAVTLARAAVKVVGAQS
jgi:hypothetical protein